ncbi:twin-arginine translocation signal domain-containing protein [Halovenus sp. HT40]|uniref:twin-arginine translocation signal domain-containing protein n=1 Tax=Halovenus sp. HT40 TaxID=3126691 RepID=UPI00300EA2C3
MVEWSRRDAITLATVAVASGVGGCTGLFVGQPDPELVEMEQRIATSGRRTVAATVTVENQGATGDVLVTIRALDSDDEPIKSVDEVHEIEGGESVELTIPIEAPEGTDRFEALVEPA